MGKTFGPEKYNGLLSAESYLRQINQFPLLTPEEEFKLAARYRKYNDREAAEKLITSNLRFVVKVAFEYKTYGIKLLDLIQEGNIGLMMAVKKFNPYKGIPVHLLCHLVDQGLYSELHHQILEPRENRNDSSPEEAFL